MSGYWWKWKGSGRCEQGKEVGGVKEIMKENLLKFRKKDKRKEKSSKDDFPMLEILPLIEF